jgi:hypothetical protein
LGSARPIAVRAEARELGVRTLLVTRSAREVAVRQQAGAIVPGEHAPDAPVASVVVVRCSRPADAETGAENDEPAHEGGADDLAAALRIDPGSARDGRERVAGTARVGGRPVVPRPAIAA